MSHTSPHSEDSLDYSDRRQFRRQRVDSLCTVSLGRENGGILLNVSESGLAAQFVAGVKDQSVFQMRFGRPLFDEEFEITGQVAWTSPSGKEAGILFIDPPETMRTRISEWISKRAAPASWTTIGSQFVAQEGKRVIAIFPGSESKDQVNKLHAFCGMSSEEFDAMFPSEIAERQSPFWELSIAEPKEALPSSSADPEVATRAGFSDFEELTNEAKKWIAANTPLTPSNVVSEALPLGKEAIHELPSPEAPRENTTTSVPETFGVKAEDVSRTGFGSSSFSSTDPSVGFAVDSAVPISFEHASRDMDEILTEDALKPSAPEILATKIFDDPEFSGPRNEHLDLKPLGLETWDTGSNFKATEFKGPSNHQGLPAERSGFEVLGKGPAGKVEASVEKKAGSPSKTPEEIATEQMIADLRTTLQRASAVRSPTRREMARDNAGHTPNTVPVAERAADPSPEVGSGSFATAVPPVLTTFTGTETASRTKMTLEATKPERQIESLAPKETQAAERLQHGIQNEPLERAVRSDKDVSRRVAFLGGLRFGLTEAFALAIAVLLLAGLLFEQGGFKHGHKSNDSRLSNAIEPMPPPPRNASDVPPTLLPAAPVETGDKKRNPDLPSHEARTPSVSSEKMSHRADEIPNAATQSVKAVSESSVASPDVRATPSANVRPQSSMEPANVPSATPAPTTPTVTSESLSKPAPSSPTPAITGEGDRVVPSSLLYRVEALYPTEAILKRIEGAVKLTAVIGRDGKVMGIGVVSGPAILVPAAISAARDWRYVPALLNGEPVESQADITIEFRLPTEGRSP